MTVEEEPLLFGCEGARLVAILHRPVEPRARGVLLIVGGPQYRAGSHRQFVLLARHLASKGFPVLRFDYRGMGDSEGADIAFTNTGADVRAALSALAGATGSREIVVWGLCDAASAALMHACSDPRVCGLVLANPWVRQTETEARAYLRHYYGARFLDREQWRRLLTGKVNPFKSAADLLKLLIKSRSGGGEKAHPAGQPAAAAFVTRMLEGLESFGGKVLVLLSGDDMTAAEFKDVVAGSPRWARALERAAVTRRDLPQADHTFSTAAWRDEAAVCTERWLESL